MELALFSPDWGLGLSFYTPFSGLASAGFTPLPMGKAARQRRTSPATRTTDFHLCALSTRPRANVYVLHVKSTTRTTRQSAGADHRNNAVWNESHGNSNDKPKATAVPRVVCSPPKLGASSSAAPCSLKLPLPHVMLELGAPSAVSNILVVMCSTPGRARQEISEACMSSDKPAIARWGSERPSGVCGASGVLPQSLVPRVTQQAGEAPRRAAWERGAAQVVLEGACRLVSFGRAMRCATTHCTATAAARLVPVNISAPPMRDGEGPEQGPHPLRCSQDAWDGACGSSRRRQAVLHQLREREL